MGIKRTPYYFAKFKCVGGVCEDNCCIGWEVDIDSDTLDVYINTNGEFGSRLRQSLSGDNSFTLKNNRCPFLNEKNLCDIFINIGEENLCTVCSEYPRFTEQFGDITEVGLGMSCISASKLIFGSDEKLHFVEEENSDTDDDYDADFLPYLLKVREKIMSILQNRDVSIKKRAVSVLAYAEKVQKCVNDNCPYMIDEIEDNSEFSQVKKGTNDLKTCMELCRDLEIMEDSWIDVVEKTLRIYNDYDKLSGEFDKYICDREYEYEQILTYFIYRYLLKADFDYDVLTKVKFAVVSYIIIRQMDISRWRENHKKFTLDDRIKNCVLYSKEVEHCQDNIDFLSEEFLFNEIFKNERFVAMVQT